MLRGGPGRAVRNGEDGKEAFHPRALATRTRDLRGPAHEPLEAGLTIPAAVLVEWHPFTITDPPIDSEASPSSLGQEDERKRRGGWFKIPPIGRGDTSHPKLLADGHDGSVNETQRKAGELAVQLRDARVTLPRDVRDEVVALGERPIRSLLLVGNPMLRPRCLALPCSGAGPLVSRESCLTPHFRRCTFQVYIRGGDVDCQRQGSAKEPEVPPGPGRGRRGGHSASPRKGSCAPDPTQEHTAEASESRGLPQSGCRRGPFAERRGGERPARRAVLIYLDTSIVVAYYCPELLSHRAEQLIRAHSQPAVSDLTEVELRSALSRKVRLAELQKKSATQIASRFSGHLEEGLYTRVPLERRHYEMASEWLSRFTLTLRTLDALHLAVAASGAFRLVTADAALARSAKALGIETRWLRR